MSTHCGLCHAPAVADCRRPFSSELVLCEQGGAGPHLIPAVWVVEYVIRSRHGDVCMTTLVCDHPACVGAAESHAETVGQLVERRPLTRADAEEASGLDLAGAR